MTLRLLPFYFKRIGLALFIGGSLPDFIRGATSGYYDFHQASPSGDTSLLPLPGQTLWVLEIIALLGIVLYALAKDKVHDELLQRLRLEAVEFTFFLAVIVASLLAITKGDFRIGATNLIYAQLIIFIVTYNIKKQAIRSSK